MSAEPLAAPAVPAPAGRRFTRRPEKWIAGIGVGLAAILQGGFALAVNSATSAEFGESIAPALRSAGIDLAASGDAVEAARTLAAWFGFSLIVVIGLAAIGFFFASRRPRRRSTGWWFLGAGLACLLGTQLVLYPVAFFLFLTAALFAARSPQQGSPS
ncbi:hypothetical protein [Microbacterium karelineae]|uniref:hypothetical protein n=1 Tax=Microbacterium karelineae TaxID=2654283 RepID=UPI0012E9B44B|nr:hypothetical protein [Microbacterium karelineae]